MKRFFSLILSLCLVLGLCACGGSQAETTVEGALSWQEQYDLGIRYLSEGNYEEAIIAFTAAIEIDPKQTDAYIGLAEVYTAQGNIVKAAEILNQALEATGENEAISSALEKLLAQEAGTPMVPEEIKHDLNFSDSQYAACTEEMARLFTPAIEAGVAGELQTMQTLLWEIFPEVTALPEMSDAVEINETVNMFSCWTQLSDGGLLDIACIDDEYKKCFNITYRPESGTGFCCNNWLPKDGSGDIWDYYVGQMEGYLWNGSFHGYHYDYGPDDLRNSRSATGSAVNEMLHGEYIEVDYEQHSAAVRVTDYWIYDHGIYQLCWQGDDGPRACKHVYADGSISYEGETQNEEPHLVF